MNLFGAVFLKTQRKTQKRARSTDGLPCAISRDPVHGGIPRGYLPPTIECKDPVGHGLQEQRGKTGVQGNVQLGFHRANPSFPDGLSLSVCCNKLTPVNVNQRYGRRVATLFLRVKRFRDPCPVSCLWVLICFFT